jgi:hypothetical protein
MADVYETFVIYSCLQDEQWDQIALKLLGSERFSNLLIAANPLYNRFFRFLGEEILIIPSVPKAALTGPYPWSSTYALT